MLAGHSWGGFLGLGYQGFLWKSHASEGILISEGDIMFHLLPELHYAPCQKGWLTLSRWIGFFHPKLEGFGKGHHLLLLQFSDIPAREFGVRQWQETLPLKAQWCWWGLVVILNPVPFADPSGELKRGPHPPCQFLMVIHHRNLRQFLPPARHVMHLGSPNHPTLQLLHQGFWGRCPPILLLQAFSWPLEEMVNIWS